MLKIKREIINEKVRNVFKENNLEEVFCPLAEEFFYRLADQGDLSEKNLDYYVEIFKMVKKISFEEIDARGMVTKESRNSQDIYVKFDMKLVKKILELDVEKTEDLMHTIMHEFGHAVQFMKNGNSGLCSYEEENGKKRMKGIGINEVTEVINADRLVNGSTFNDLYRSYRNIINAGKVVLNSLGLSKSDIANLQWLGRENYEKYVTNKLKGIPAKMYIDSFDTYLDSILKFSKEDQRKNLISSVEALQTLSKKLFEERYKNIEYDSNNPKKIFEDIAKIYCDEKEKYEALKKVFKQFEIRPEELEIDKCTSINEASLKGGVSEDDMREIYNAERKEEYSRWAMRAKEGYKTYDNRRLREYVYNACLGWYKKYSQNEVNLWVVGKQSEGKKQRKLAYGENQCELVYGERHRLWADESKKGAAGGEIVGGDEER